MTDTRTFALINGASRGIGHQSARQFATHGYGVNVGLANRVTSAPVSR